MTELSTLTFLSFLVGGNLNIYVDDDIVSKRHISQCEGNVVNQLNVFYGSSSQPFQEGGELDLAAFQLQCIELILEEMKG